MIPGIKDELYLKFNAPIAHWGVVQTIIFGPSYKGKTAVTLRTYDMGVKLRDGKYYLAVQALDTAIDNDPKLYKMRIQIWFMAEQLDIVWPTSNQSRKKPVKPKKSPKRVLPR